MTVPRFQNGSLLFCNGGLAASCCPGGYGDWDDSEDGYDWDENPPCDPPEDWDGHWCIMTICNSLNGGGGGVGCEGQRPFVRVILNYDGVNPCEYAFAAFSVWGFGRVDMFINDVAHTDYATWEIIIDDGEPLTRQILVIGGQDNEYEYELPESYHDLFSTLGRHTIKSKVTMPFPGGGFREIEYVAHVYSAGYSFAPEMAETSVEPDVTLSRFINDVEETPIGHVVNEDERWLYLISKLRTYTTSDRAWEVYNAHIDAITDYAENCVCDCECPIGDPICSAGTISSPGNGVFDPGFAGCEHMPAVSECQDMYYSNWRVETTGSGFEFTFQIKRYGGEWVDVATAAAPNTCGPVSGVLYPCDEVRVWLYAGPSASGEFAFFGNQSCSVESDCTEAIENAFALVPES